MATAITQAQLNQVQTLADSNQTAQAWQLLASFGDKYAAAAYDVIANPTSFYGVVTRQQWNNTGADFSKFSDVGKGEKGPGTQLNSSRVYSACKCNNCSYRERFSARPHVRRQPNRNPPSFIALYLTPGRERPNASHEVILARYELCEDMARMFTEHAQKLAFDEDMEQKVLRQCHDWLLADPSTLSAQASAWVMTGWRSCWIGGSGL